MNSEAPELDPNDPAARAVPGRTVVTVLVVGMLLVFGLMATARLLAPGMMAARKNATRIQCAATLRVIGDAARRQAQDTGWFAHQAAKPETLDGGADTTDGPRVFRSMLKRGYLEDPASLVCPAQPRLRRAQREGQEAQDRWIRTGEGEAPTLAAAIPISFGWTRRGLKADAAATTPLSADKAVVPRAGQDGVMKGNHTDGWTLLRAGGAVEFLSLDADPFPGSWLAKTASPTDGFLGIADQDQLATFGR